MTASRRRFFRFRPLPVENSKVLRAWTFVLVLIGVLAILNEEEWPPFGWVAVGLTGLGYWLSYIRRGRSNWLLKTLICFCMVWAMQRFFVELFASANDPRIPLANLLLWLQTMHAFDLPYRQNLNVSFYVGVVLMAVAAVMSVTGMFGIFLVAFVVASVFMLQCSYLSWRNEVLSRQNLDPESETAPIPAPIQIEHNLNGRILLRYLGIFAGCVVVGFGAVPHLSGLRIRTLPISVQHQLARMTSGKIVNPAYPDGIDQAKARGGKIFDPDNYHGFNNELDLNVRGHLSNDIVMRVRSSRWTYYRALAFNHYDGSSWKITDETLEKATSGTPPVRFHVQYEGSEDLVQIFYIDKDMSNVMLGCYQIRDVYFPGDTLYMDRYGGVRADFPMLAGTTYSVVSSVRPDVPALLRRQGSKRPNDGKTWRNLHGPIAPFLELPATVPDRVRQLARQLTAKYSGSYDKAMALATFLKHTYPYSLDTPSYPPDVDAADYFLYTAKAGSCEQFATSLAVLCRAADIPARLVVGYLPGNFNPISGVYEVRSADAHAWVEIWLPFYNWVALDATPGGDIEPNLVSHEHNLWVLQSLFTYLTNRFTLPPAVYEAFDRLRQQWSAWADRWMAGSRGTVLGALMIVFATTASVLMLFYVLSPPLRRSAQVLNIHLPAFLTRPLGSSAASPAPPALDAMQLEYQRMLDLLARHGQVKSAGQTPTEFARTTAALEVDHVTHMFEACRYGRRPITPDDLEAVRQELRTLEERLSPKS